MKFFTNLILLSCFSILLISNSCEVDKKDNPVTKDSNQIQSNDNNLSPEERRLDSVRMIKQEEYLRNQEQKEKQKDVLDKIVKEKNLSKENLISFLPQKIDGFVILPTMTGKTQENDTSFTVFVKRHFKDNSRRSVSFELYDYGRGNQIPNAVIYDVVPGDLDAPAYPYKNSYSKGFFYWLDKKIYGHIEVLVSKRFVVIVRLNGFNRDDKVLENYIEMVKFKDLFNSSK